MSLPFAHRALLALLAIAAASPALAHHPMDGAPLDTFQLGLLSGLGHPILGMDHLAALVGVGLLAWRFGKAGTLLPLAWVAAMGLGVFLHMQAVDLPLAEVLVAMSVIAIGAIGVLRVKLPAGSVAALFALAGLFHGHALAESIIGAEPAPLTGYIIGLVAIQGAIMTGVMLLTGRLLMAGTVRPAQVRIAAGLVAAIGIGFLALAVAGSGAA